MKNEFIITATNNIEGCPIEKYIDTICTNVVIGANIFSDIAASFTDLFGGHSNSYKSKLDLIYNEASKEIKNKAVNLGANAIVGFHVDFDEISGNGKSMFMISVSGTACYVNIKSKNNIIDKTSINKDSIPQQYLEKEIKRRSIINKINNGCSYVESEWMDFYLKIHKRK